MTTKESIMLMLSTLFLILLGYFVKFPGQESVVINYCEEAIVHPFLCQKKIKLSQAKMFDLTQVDGLSRKLARKIHDYITRNPGVTVLELDNIKGVGAKTVLKLQDKFY